MFVYSYSILTQYCLHLVAVFATSHQKSDCFFKVLEWKLADTTRMS